MSTYYGLIMPTVYTGGVYIRSIRQTKTATEPGGTNEITATLTNRKSETFFIKNGEGVVSHEYARNGEDGGESILKIIYSDGTEDIIVVTNGATGAAAGFAEPSAEAVTLAPDTEASAAVEASGPATAKKFSFTFGIPKGEKGDKGDAPDTLTEEQLADVLAAIDGTAAPNDNDDDYEPEDGEEDA